MTMGTRRRRTAPERPSSDGREPARAGGDRPPEGRILGPDAITSGMSLDAIQDKENAASVTG